ncbi:hypothetical protein J2Z37_001271 [Ammoniphilus resinae]|uniref:Uncharacterized protein n=1 Tax=Ammoniphilus resinae TaxID=861532 RepID=A0ABS4GM04_9BACL|nr:hypothetical protein [Ammoniphilus resinae]
MKGIAILVKKGGSVPPFLSFKISNWIGAPVVNDFTKAIYPNSNKYYKIYNTDPNTMELIRRFIGNGKS